MAVMENTDSCEKTDSYDYLQTRRLLSVTGAEALSGALLAMRHVYIYFLVYDVNMTHQKLSNIFTPSISTKIYILNQH